MQACSRVLWRGRSCRDVAAQRVVGMNTGFAPAHPGRPTLETLPAPPPPSKTLFRPKRGMGRTIALEPYGLFHPFHDDATTGLGSQRNPRAAGGWSMFCDWVSAHSTWNNLPTMGGHIPYVWLARF